MNKGLSNITKATAAIALTAVIFACNQGKPTPAATATGSKTETTAAASASDKIVFINSDSLLNNYQFYKDLKVKFEDKSKKAQADLGTKNAAFQREVAQYQQGAATMSADQRQETEKRLARKQQELQAYQQNASAAFANEQGHENEKLYDKVAEYLKKYAKDKGYKMVLTYAKGNSTVLYADASLDVTKDVIAGLNTEYKKEDKK